MPDNSHLKKTLQNQDFGFYSRYKPTDQAVENAKELFKRLIKIDNERYEGYLNLSNLLTIEKKYKQANDLLQNYLKKINSHPEIINALAINLFNSTSIFICISSYFLLNLNFLLIIKFLIFFNPLIISLYSEGDIIFFLFNIKECTSDTLRSCKANLLSKSIDELIFSNKGLLCLLKLEPHIGLIFFLFFFIIFCSLDNILFLG